MLVIHWSPVKNTKTILKRGIRKSKRGVFCFPLTGHRSVDRWWAQAFRSYWRPRTQYNGFVFRVAQADLPAKFCDWVVEPFAPSPIYTELHALEAAIKTTLLWRLENNWRQTGISDPETIEQFIRQDSSIISRLRSDAALMDFVFKDHQILLSHSIPPHRILRVIPGSNMSGRERTRNRRLKIGTRAATR